MVCLKSVIGPRHFSEEKMGETEFKFYLSEHLLIPRDLNQSALPLRGSIGRSESRMTGQEKKNVFGYIMTRNT